jgi:Na+-transporting methylmalonyl-CoA/oxaloacetate decarboxylase gamma subunit
MFKYLTEFYLIMKKMGGKFSVCFLFAILSLSILVFAQSTNPWSSTSAGIEKNTFDVNQSVYVQSNTLCEPASSVDLYIVENSDNWADGDSLVDVRDDFQKINLVGSKIPATLIWSNPVVGNYDIVADCNSNGIYDMYIDKIDSFNSTGFTIQAQAGLGTVKQLGKSQTIIWGYDPESEENNFLIGLLQLNLTASKESIILDNMTIQAAGSVDDTLIEHIQVYLDENNNGKVDEEELAIGEADPFEEDNGLAVINLDYTLEKDSPADLLVVYTLNEELTGNLSFDLLSLYGTGQDSKSTISFTGLPIKSSIVDIGAPRTCIGELTLVLSPETINSSQEVLGTVSGVTGCDNKTVILRNTPCESISGIQAGSCILSEDECTIKFTVKSTAIYYACIDKNSDSNYLDSGESAFAQVTVNKAVNATSNITEGNTTTNEEENETTQVPATPTGNVIDDLGQKISQAGNFFVILEITLVLILLVLLVIMFRLRSQVVKNTTTPIVEAKETKETPKETSKPVEKSNGTKEKSKKKE